MKMLPDGRACFRVRITGTYKGKPWTYEDPPGDHGYGYANPPDIGIGKWEQSEYWWAEGNMSCDCNRIGFVGLTPDTAPELYHMKGSFYQDGSGPVEQTHVRCGETICITSIVPIDCDWAAPLVLNERKS